MLAVRFFPPNHAVVGNELPYPYCSQYVEDNSHNFEHFREPDCSGSYSPWSCDTFGPYIGGKDIKSKEGKNAMGTVSFACLEVHKGFSSSCIFTPQKNCQRHTLKENLSLKSYILNI